MTKKVFRNVKINILVHVVGSDKLTTQVNKITQNGASVYGNFSKMMPKNKKNEFFSRI